MTTRCKLLRYKTINDPSYAPKMEDNLDDEVDARLRKKRRINAPDSLGAGAKIHELGDKDGKVECSYCWTVKRDVFDIPMLIVMNVSNLSNSLTWLTDKTSFFLVYE